VTLQDDRAAEWEQLGEAEEYAALVRQRLEHVVPVAEPLVLCSQIQRSGGTLLSQLFDGHHECHAHPHEIKIGYPREANWPPLDLERPGEWFERLFEKKALTHFVEGYQKRGAKLEGKSYPSYDVFPFLFLPRLQKAIFDACVAGREVRGDRDILDCYFTSYFNAWLDNQNLCTGPKKVVTGFTPRLAMDPGNRDKFFAAYPGGTLIAIVREPHSWYESAVKYSLRRFPDVETALGLWRGSAEAALDPRVVAVTYERLVGRPAEVMTRIAERIGIAMSPVLLEPTFNGRPIRANSADEVAQYGILATRTGSSLDAETAAQVTGLAGDLYDRAAAVSV
jgi:Sulfotransferase family